MHDELGQILTATRCTIATVTPEEFAARRVSYLEALDDAVSATRELSQLLRPVILDDFGLDEALRWLSEGFEDRTGIVCSYKSDCKQRFEDETETHLFRIAQESLTNIARHSGASRAAISLMREGNKVTLTIEDNGCGLPPKESRKGPSLGVIGMRARAHQIGGQLHMGRGDLGGAMIRVQAPARGRDEDAAA
jgi:signal transduction histidine kinase